MGDKLQVMLFHHKSLKQLHWSLTKDSAGGTNTILPKDIHSFGAEMWPLQSLPLVFTWVEI